MINIYKDDEIKKIKESGHINHMTHEYLSSILKPGITTKYLDEEAGKFIRSHGGIPSSLGYEGFPANICISVNDEIVHGIGSEDCVLREGDIIMVSTNLVQFIGNVEKFNNLFFILGYIINTIPYDKIYEYIMDAMSLNGYSYGLNSQVFGFIISELCRYKDNPNIPWRLSGSTDPHAYQSMSVKGISKLISPYTAILSEDFDESIMYAMMNDDPQDSSLERVLVGGKSPIKEEK